MHNFTLIGVLYNKGNLQQMFNNIIGGDKMKRMIVSILIISLLFVLSGCNPLNSNVPDYPNIEITDTDAWGLTGHYTLTIKMDNKGGEDNVRLEVVAVKTGYPPEEQTVIDDIFPVPSDTEYIVEYDIKNLSIWKFHITLHQWSEDGFEKVEKIEDIKIN